MKKKFWVSALAVLSAACCAVGLAACTDDGDDIDKDTDVSEVQSQTVTEAQWKEAFQAENFVNFKMFTNITYVYNGVTQTGTQEMIVDGDKYYEKDTMGEESDECYYAVLDSVNYLYEKEDSAWTRSQVSYNPVSGLREMLTAYADVYSDFEYSEKDKGYVMVEEDEEEDYAQTYTVKITNGKLSGMIVKYEQYEDGEVVKSNLSSAAVYDYGKASVTLPTVQGDDNGDTPVTGSEVTEAQWKAALSENAFINCKVEAILTSGLGAGAVEIPYATILSDLEHNRVYLMNYGEDTELFLVQTDDTYYYYRHTDVQWTRSVLTEEQFNYELMGYSSVIEMVEYLRDSYDEFTYDEENGFYFYEQNNGSQSDRVELTFSDGKLCLYDEIMQTVEFAGIQTLKFSDYGTTQIPALPAQYEDVEYSGGGDSFVDPSQMDEETWIQAFETAAHSEGFRLRSYHVEDGEIDFQNGQETSVNFVENTYYMWQTSTYDNGDVASFDMLYRIEGHEYVSYNNFGTGWFREVVTQAEFEDTSNEMRFALGLFLTAMQTNFDLFTFEEGCFVLHGALEVDTDDNGGKMVIDELNVYLWDDLYRFDGQMTVYYSTGSGDPLRWYFECDMNAPTWFPDPDEDDGGEGGSGIIDVAECRFVLSHLEGKFNEASQEEWTERLRSMFGDYISFGKDGVFAVDNAEITDGTYVQSDTEVTVCFTAPGNNEVNLVFYLQDQYLIVEISEGVFAYYMLG